MHTVRNSPNEALPRAVAGRQPGDTTLDKPVLDAAARIFVTAHKHSGVAAILFRHIRRNNLFKLADHRSMRGYAMRVLGIKSRPAYKRTAAAGEAAWEFYRPLCQEVLERVARGDTIVASSFPAVPNEWVLSQLKGAVSTIRAEEGKDAAKRLIDSVLSGEYRGKDLVAIKQHRPTLEIPAIADDDDATGRPEEHDQPPEDVEGALRAMAIADKVFRHRSAGTLSRATVNAALRYLRSLAEALTHHDKALRHKLQVYGRRGTGRNVLRSNRHHRRQARRKAR